MLQRVTVIFLRAFPYNKVYTSREQAIESGFPRIQEDVADVYVIFYYRLNLTEKFGETPLREFLASENLYAGSAASLTESEARTILRAGSIDAARTRIFEAGQQSLRAAQPGVFSEARPHLAHKS